MNFQDIFMKLRNKDKTDLIEAIEDFRDVLSEKSSQIGDPLTSSRIIDLIRGDQELIVSAKKIPEQGNLRKVVVNLAIRELLNR